MSKVFISAYSVPKFGKRSSEQETWEVIERNIYGNSVIPLTLLERKELTKQIISFAPKMSFNNFCNVFNWGNKTEIVYLVAKYLGVGFNQINFSIQEDYLIRAFYPVFGKYTNEVIFDILQYDMGDTLYELKTSQEIQDRVDTLQQGSKYSKFDFIKPKQFNHLLGKKSTALICVHNPKNRLSYTSSEKVLLKLQKSYGLNFLPWKDSNEVKYWLGEDSKFNQSYCANCKDIVFNSNEHTIGAHLRANYRAVIGLILQQKVMRIFDSTWNSYLDTLLDNAIKTLKSNINISTTNMLNNVYSSLIKNGKSVEDCENRRIIRGIAVPWGFKDIEYCLNSINMTSSEISDNKPGIKHTSRGVMYTRDRAENKMGKPLYLWTDEEKAEYMNRIGQRFSKQE